MHPTEKKHRIVHPEHGEAQCSEHQIEEFTDLGWEAVDSDEAGDQGAEGDKPQKSKKPKKGGAAE